MVEEEFVVTTPKARKPSARQRKLGEAAKKAGEADALGQGSAAAPEPGAHFEGDGCNCEAAYPPDSMAAAVHELAVTLRAVATEAAVRLPQAIEAGRVRLRQVQRAEAAKGDFASVALLDAYSLLLDALDALAISIETSVTDAMRRERQRILDMLNALDDEPPAAEHRPLPESGRQSGPLAARSTNSQPLAHPLTPQERVVLGLLAEGAGTPEIAEALTISPTTAKKHVCNVLEKLGASDRLKAVVRAQVLGLLPPHNTAR